MGKIEATTKIFEIYRKYPKVANYLLELGICGCEDLSELKNTVEDVAKQRKIDIEKFLIELNKRI